MILRLFEMSCKSVCPTLAPPNFKQATSPILSHLKSPSKTKIALKNLKKPTFSEGKYKKAMKFPQKHNWHHKNAKNLTFSKGK